MTAAQSVEMKTFENAESLAQNAAEWLCAIADSSKGDFGVCLSGGSTPRRLYQLLATPAIASRFPWTRAHWFWGDERFVPHDDPESNETHFFRVSHLPATMFARWRPRACRRRRPRPRTRRH
jgi:6-phosphogluconolactonase